MRQIFRRCITTIHLFRKPCYHFSEIKPMIDLNNTILDYPQTNEFAEKTDMLASLNEFEQGINFLQAGKYRLALEFFTRVKNYLEKNSFNSSDSWRTVNRKIAQTQLNLRRYSDCEETLEKIIEHSLKENANEAVIYQSYNNLLIHCLKTNLNKAILLGKALVFSAEKDHIPLAYQKLFLFNLGTAYILKENYIDAKEKLRECLSMDPNSQLKGFTLNNLAVASWWHKIPNLREFVSDDEDESAPPSQNPELYSDEQIDEDFKQVIPLLKRSLRTIESISEKDQQQQSMLETLFDEATIIPKDFKLTDSSMYGSLHLKQIYSGKPLLNISEFIFNTDSKKRIEAQFWFKNTIKFFEKNDPNNMDRSLILLAWLCSSSKQYERAEILFRRTLQLLDSTDSYNKILCLQLYGSMLKQNPDKIQEGEKLIVQAYALAQELPAWSNKLVHVLVPDMEL